MNQVLSTIIKSEGWNEVLRIFDEEMKTMCDCRNIKKEIVSDLGKEAIARAKATELIDTVIKRIYREANDIKKEKIQYI